MTYQDIPGWFTWEPLYQRMVDQFPSGSVFVEIGTYLGKSACFMAQQIKRSGKMIDFFCIDPWDVDVSGHSVAAVGGSWFPHFWQNVRLLELECQVIPMPLRNVDAAKHFCLDKPEFVFIDAEHDYQSVRKDIETWRPLVFQGGVMAGHDYTTNQETKQAVDDCFGSSVQVEGECWWVQL